MVLQRAILTGTVAYCTGLLLAHRVLKKLEMDEEYEGNLEATGEDYSVEPADSRRPFRALLDVGLIRITTANCVFGALKCKVWYCFQGIAWAFEGMIFALVYCTAGISELEAKKIAPDLYLYGSRGSVGAHYLAANYNVRWGDLAGDD